MKKIDELKGFYKHKKILITGNTGFKGTWMTLVLEMMEADIYGFALPSGNPYVSDTFYQNINPDIAGIFYGDISDYKCLKKVVDLSCPDIIFHLASHSSLNHSMDLPHWILQTNLMGALNVLEAARNQTSVKAVVVVTSDKVYRNMDMDTKYSEESPLGGNDPYSTSKICQELLAKCYYHNFNNYNLATARASNVLGPGDYNITRLFPYLVDCLSHGEVPQIRNPYSIRSWQSVLDVIIGYLMLGKYLYEHDINHDIKNDISYNFGPNEDGFVTVAEMVNMVCKEFGLERYLVNDLPGHIQHEAKILKLNSDKAYKVLGWKPLNTLYESVHQSIEMIKQEQEGMDLRLITGSYVKEYIEKWENCE